MRRENKENITAFIECFRRQHGPEATIEDLSEPDLVPQVGGAVDFIFRIGSARYVLEHTLLPVAIRQIYEDRLFERLVWPLQDESLGPFTMATDADPDTYKAATRMPAAWQAKVRDWLKENGSNIREGQSAEVYISGVRLVVSRDSNGNGLLQVGRIARPHDANSAKEIQESVDKTMSENLGKIFRASANGEESILLLECNDISTGGAWNLVPPVAKVLKQGNAPDFVFFMQTWRARILSIAIIKFRTQIFENAGVVAMPEDDWAVSLHLPLPLGH